jgi:hypothetical protein
VSWLACHGRRLYARRSGINNPRFCITQLSVPGPTTRGPSAPKSALRQAEHGAGAQRTFRFRHTGNLHTKFAEARQVLGMTIDYQNQFKALADLLAREPISRAALEHRVLRHLWVIGDDTGARARAHRERAIERVLAIYRGRGDAGDTTGNSPGSKWTAFNAIAEHLDYGRRYTSRTNQVQRSFEDTTLKQRALALVEAA